jgi:hypothetical protein
MSAASVIREGWVHPKARRSKKKETQGSTVWVRKDKGTRLHLLRINSRSIGCGLKYDPDLYHHYNIPAFNNVAFCKTCEKNAKLVGS